MPRWGARRLSPKAPIVQHLNPRVTVISGVAVPSEIGNAISVSDRWIQIRVWLCGNECANNSAELMDKSESLELLSVLGGGGVGRRELKPQICGCLAPCCYDFGFSFCHGRAMTAND